jgi:hypothetical protein
MTYEEVIEKYGNVVVTFSSYYKYRFRYSSILENGDRIIVEIGGSPDDIYRLEVMVADVFTISELEPIGGWINDKDGITIESFIY